MVIPIYKYFLPLLNRYTHPCQYPFISLSILIQTSLLSILNRHLTSYLIIQQMWYSFNDPYLLPLSTRFNNLPEIHWDKYKVFMDVNFQLKFDIVSPSGLNRKDGLYGSQSFFVLICPQSLELYFFKLKIYNIYILLLIHQNSISSITKVMYFID